MALFRDEFRQAAHDDNNDPATPHYAIRVVAQGEGRDVDATWVSMTVDEDRIYGTQEEAQKALDIAVLAIATMGAIPIYMSSMIGGNLDDWESFDRDGKMFSVVFACDDVAFTIEGYCEWR